jgi:hypothetical protein
MRAAIHPRRAITERLTAIEAEWWQQTSPPYAERVLKGRVGDVTEQAADGMTASEYDPVTNTIYQHPDASPLTLIDPISAVRTQLESGNAQVAGSVVIDGASLYKIALPNGVIGYFDEKDYLPVYIDNPQDDGTVVRTRVVAYDEVPATAENEQLLSLAAQHAGARINTDPKAVPSQPENPGKR